MPEITELLQAWNKGDNGAMDKLMSLVEKELKKIAHNYMRKERAGHILQTTALVHEAFIRLIRENISWENRKQFYAFTAKRMRQVLVDYARKRPKGEFVDIDDVVISDEKPTQVLRLDEALKELARLDERKSSIVEYRFFVGLTNAEIAELLGIAEATVQRDWEFSRSWLKKQMIDVA